jgi:hypothetical protein
LVNPQITLTVLEYAKRRFTVLGQVQKPGTFEIPSEESVGFLEAIAMAGGFTRLANTGKIVVTRMVSGKKSTFVLDARAITADGNTGVIGLGFRVRFGPTSSTYFSAEVSPHHLLLTDETYGDVEIYFEVKIDWGCDSGIFFRTTAGDRAYQVNVDHLTGGGIGTIYGESFTTELRQRDYTLTNMGNTAIVGVGDASSAVAARAGRERGRQQQDRRALC